MKNKKALKNGSRSLVVSAIFLVVVIFLNLFVRELPSEIINPDFTDNKLMSLTDDTKEYLEKLKDDVNIYIIFDESTGSGYQNISVDTKVYNQYLNRMLERYEDISSHISFSTVDPAEKPAFIKGYTEESVKNNSLIVESSKRNTVVPFDEILQYAVEYSENIQYLPANEFDSARGYYYQYQQMDIMQYATANFFGENAVTGAIDYVTSDNLPVAYYTTGHGEADFGTVFTKTVEDENIVLKELTLRSGDEVTVPEDAAVIFMNSPAADIDENEKDALISYLDNGGDIVLMTSFDKFSKELTPNLAAVCDHMGLEAVEADEKDEEGYQNLVIESNQERYYGYPYYIMPTVTGSGFTANIDTSNYTVLSVFSHGITDSQNAENVETYSLLQTSSDAFLYKEEAIEDMDSVSDKTSYSLAYQSVIVDGNATTDGGSLIWFGSALVFDDNIINGTGNVLLLNGVLSDTCEKVTSVSVIGKPIVSNHLTISDADTSMWVTVMCIAFPIIILAAGIIVWIIRLRK